MTTTPESVAERLVSLGFSTYEARTYVGLLGTGLATGYAVANATGVPQPKVYETLRRLAERGAVAAVAGQPARWTAIPPETLLEKLDREFTDRLDAARAGLADLGTGADPGGQPRVVWHQTRREAILASARAALDAATTHVYLSGNGPVLGELADAVAAAARRDVEFTILHFGNLPFPAPRGRTVRHATTDAVLRPSARAHHLALVVDSQHALWAVAREGRRWEGLHADDPLLAALVKGYIRHDVFVQRMYEELPDELERRFGPGLLALADLSTAGDDPALADPGRIA